MRNPPGLLTSGPLRSVVFRLALPVLAEQMLSYLVGLVDTWLSGRLGAAETSAVGLSAYVGWLASLLFGLVAVGTTALVSRSWGRAGGRRLTEWRISRSRWRPGWGCSSWQRSCRRPRHWRRRST